MEREQIITIVSQMLSHLSWSIPEDFISFSHFCRELEDVDMSSSPGYPYCATYVNNQQFLKASEGIPNPERVADLYSYVLNYLDGTPANPIRLFVKPEPNSKKKHENLAYRLISSVSIRERMVDAMCFGPMNRRMIETWPISPIRIGWSPLKGGWKQMHFYSQHAADRSNWDWTVNPWLLEMCLEIRIRLCENMSDTWKKIAMRRYVDLFSSPWFVTSGGLYLRQLEPGVQKSGCYNTTADNSIMQLVLHAFACQRLNLEPGSIITVGDDTLQTPQPDVYYEFLSKYCQLKPVEEVVEFCGYRFSPGGVVDPVHVNKHAYNLLHMSPSVASDMALSYSVVYHRGNERDWILSLFKRLGLKVFDKNVLDLLWDGLDGNDV